MAHRKKKSKAEIVRGDLWMGLHCRKDLGVMKKNNLFLGRINRGVRHKIYSVVFGAGDASGVPCLVLGIAP